MKSVPHCARYGTLHILREFLLTDKRDKVWEEKQRRSWLPSVMQWLRSRAGNRIQIS